MPEAGGKRTRETGEGTGAGAIKGAAMEGDGEDAGEM